ncbi:MAG: glycerophosphodiester phosphodiesterase [Angelakisella sp.]
MIKIVAHRGSCQNYPENTMLAFQKAVEVDSDGIELDVQLTADGEAVIIHDETVDRTTDGTGQVRSMTLAELRKLNAHGAFPGKFDFQPIPTLREYFSYMADKRQFTNIELKNSIYDYPQLEEKVVALIREFHLEDRIQFSSFNHFSMVRCKELAPEIPTGLLTSSWMVRSGAYGRSLGANYINPMHTFCTPENVAEVQSEGLNCNAWTVNNPERMQALAALNIESIITNCPDTAIALLWK